MFEDSTFDSTGRIRTRSRDWMMAAFTFNGSILMALVLIPLINPEALPHQALAFLMEAPAPPPTPQPQPKEPQSQFHGVSEMVLGQIVAPSKIPDSIAKFSGREAEPIGSIQGWGQEIGIPGSIGDVFHGQTAKPIVHQETKGPMRVSSSVVAGLLLRKTLPVYPAIAKAARQEGTVVLQATISAAGTIENLRVVRGPAMLQQAALDAVKTWIYRPYLLNNQPIEVETTVDVVFVLTR